MDNNISSSILHACKLARDLESNLPNHSLASLSDSCHHIIQAFSEARDRINSSRTSHTGATGGSSNVYSQAMAALFQPQLQPHQLSCSTATSDTAAAAAAGVQKSMQMQQPIIMDVSSSADHPYATLTGASSSSHGPRSRRKVDDRRTVEVGGPEYGNTDIPPDDGFTWKKYGQKEILGCLFPRSYYRCTHQKLYNCPAKKQVQRLDSSPTTYQLTYRGLHTCHLSATAPAVHNNNTMPQWLLSHHHSVADMADAMFNSTTTNTIDLIFSSHHHSPPHINSEPDNKND